MPLKVGDAGPTDSEGGKRLRQHDCIRKDRPQNNRLEEFNKNTRNGNGNILSKHQSIINVQAPRRPKNVGRVHRKKTILKRRLSSH